MASDAVGLETAPLTNMVAVGAVDARSARIWFRSEIPGRLAVEWWPEGDRGDVARLSAEIPGHNESDNTGAVTVPPPDGGHPPLEPVTPYRFRVTHEESGVSLGEGRFETFPADRDQMPSRFAIGLLSCHQPFTKDGRLRESAPQMLRAARQSLREHDTKFVLELGDQMYSDYPAYRSLVDSSYLSEVSPNGKQRLTDCTAAEIRQLYHHRYHYFWNIEEWKRLHAEFPCLPILDDHDIIDNWGSDPNHKRPHWQPVGLGARQAYFDYQGSRIHDPAHGLPESFHYGFSYGAVSTYVMDIRSKRTAGENGQLFGQAQEADFKEFLEANGDQSVLLIVLSVPVIHLPRILTRIVAKLPPSNEDFSDRWSSGNHIHDRDRFLNILKQHQQRHPSQKVVLVSGDIHVGCAHKITWDGADTPPMYQFVSSGITHETTSLFEFSARILMRMKHRVSAMDHSLHAEVTRVRAADSQAENPYGKLNLGIIDFDFSRDGEVPDLRFNIYGHEEGRPKRVYRSEVI